MSRKFTRPRGLEAAPTPTPINSAPGILEGESAVAVRDVERAPIPRATALINAPGLESVKAKIEALDAAVDAARARANADWQLGQELVGVRTHAFSISAEEAAAAQRRIDVVSRSGKEAHRQAAVLDRARGGVRGYVNRIASSWTPGSPLPISIAAPSKPFKGDPLAEIGRIDAAMKAEKSAVEPLDAFIESRLASLRKLKNKSTLIVSAGDVRLPSEPVTNVVADGFDGVPAVSAASLPLLYALLPNQIEAEVRRACEKYYADQLGHLAQRTSSERAENLQLLRAERLACERILADTAWSAFNSGADLVLQLPDAVRDPRAILGIIGPEPGAPEHRRGVH